MFFITRIVGCVYRGYAASYYGTNPSLAALKSAMQNLATTYNVPIEIIAAVCYNESGFINTERSTGSSFTTAMNVVTLTAITG